MKDANELLVSSGPKVFLEQWGKARARVRETASVKATVKSSAKASTPAAPESGPAVPETVTAPAVAVSRRTGTRVTARTKGAPVPAPASSPKVAEESGSGSKSATAPEAAPPAVPPSAPVPLAGPDREAAPESVSAPAPESATEAVPETAIPPAPEAAIAAMSGTPAALPVEQSAPLLTSPALAPGTSVPFVPAPHPVAAVTPLPEPAAPLIPAVLALSPEIAAKEENEPRLARDSAGAYVFAPGPRAWRVKGLSAFGADRLRVNVRVDEGKRFHVDTFDLYAARSRNLFIEAAVNALRLDGESKAVLADELASLIEALEKERLALRSEGSGEAKEHVLSAAERAEAMAMLMGDIVACLTRDFLAVGCVGEETALLTGYLAMVSRKLAEPLSVLFCARSGAGKSTLQDRLCDFCPPEDLVKYTRISGQVLFYKDEDALKHKLLAVDEEDGAAQAAYALRSLLSSGYLSCSVTRTDPQTGRQVADDRRVNGPATNFLTTSHPEALDYETRNRYVMVTVDESREQTARILALQRWNETVEGLKARAESAAVLRRHHNAQRLLEPLDVVIPVELAYPSGYLILRREQKKYLTLIKAVALLHQHQRKRRTLQAGGQNITYIEASEKDVQIARGLASAILRRNLDELAPPSRSLLAVLQEIVRAKKQALASSGKEKDDKPEADGKPARRYLLRGEPRRDERLLMSRQEIQQQSGLSYWHVRTYMAQLIEYEYVAQVRGHQGQRTLYELLWEEEHDDPAAGIA